MLRWPKSTKNVEVEHDKHINCGPVEVSECGPVEVSECGPVEVSECGPVGGIKCDTLTQETSSSELFLEGCLNLGSLLPRLILPRGLLGALLIDARLFLSRLHKQRCSIRGYMSETAYVSDAGISRMLACVSDASIPRMRAFQTLAYQEPCI